MPKAKPQANLYKTAKVRSHSRRAGAVKVREYERRVASKLEPTKRERSAPASEKPTSTSRRAQLPEPPADVLHSNPI